MREIKFRAWSNYSKKTNHEFRMYDVQTLWLSIGMCEIDDDAVGIDNVILMQYTGLKRQEQQGYIRRGYCKKVYRLHV